MLRLRHLAFVVARWGAQTDVWSLLNEQRADAGWLSTASDFVRHYPTPAFRLLERTRIEGARILLLSPCSGVRATPAPSHLGYADARAQS